MSAKKPITHPSTQRLFQTAAARWNRLRREHQDVTARLWAGTMVTQFSADELSLLGSSGYLSELDRILLKAVRKATADDGRRLPR